jgi:hypothetical protein
MYIPYSTEAAIQVLKTQSHTQRREQLYNEWYIQLPVYFKYLISIVLIIKPSNVTEWGRDQIKSAVVFQWNKSVG